jgi:heme/copper-type cytochrome/quinol oxidase subunit 1
MREFETALGQFLIYRALLRVRSSRRKVVLAVDEEAYDNFLTMHAVQLILREYKVSLLVVRLDIEEILQWID